MAEAKTEKEELIEEFTESLKTLTIDECKKKDFFKNWLIKHGFPPTLDYMFTVGGIYCRFLFNGLNQMKGEK